MTHPLIIKTNNEGYKPWINKLDTCTWTWTGNYHNQALPLVINTERCNFITLALLTIFFSLHLSPLVIWSTRRQNFCSAGAQRKSGCGPAEQNNEKSVFFLEIFAVFNFGSNLVEYQCINLTYLNFTNNFTSFEVSAILGAKLIVESKFSTYEIWKSERNMNQKSHCAL